MPIRFFPFYLVPFKKQFNTFFFVLVFKIMLLVGNTLSANSYHVTVNGLPSGDGSDINPWDLASALSHPSVVQPGDTIWLHGGTYLGHFTSQLAGQSGLPIWVIQYPGESAVLDGNLGIDADAVLKVMGSYTNYKGFEITNSDPNRISAFSGGNPTDINVVSGMFIVADHSKFINLIVHDNLSNGIGFWQDAVDSEIHGCIIFNNGYDGTDRGHGHAIYTQNLTGTKLLSDNIMFNGLAYGIHAYAQAGNLIGFDCIGNIGFNSGIHSAHNALRSNFQFGGFTPVNRLYVANNYSYHELNMGGFNTEFGFSSSNDTMTVINNYLVGGSQVLRVKEWEHVTLRNNVIYGLSKLVGMSIPGGFSSANYNWEENSWYKGNSSSSMSGVNFNQWQSMFLVDANSQYSSNPPTTNSVFVRPNGYENGRGHVAIFNWELRDSVLVDLSNIVEVGDFYEVRDVQDLFSNTPLRTGIYSGGSIYFPMDLTSVTSINGNIPNVGHTGKNFGAFLVTSGKDTNSINKVLTITGPTEVCKGGTITLSPSEAGGVWVVTAGAGTFAGNNLTTTAGPLTAEYSINGCTVTHDITVHDLPALSIDSEPGTILCETASLTLNGIGALNYTWDNNVDNGIAFIPPLGTTRYVMTGVDGNNCVDTASVDVVVNNCLPTAEFGVSDSSVCEGVCTDFNELSHGVAANSWRWYFPGSSIVTSTDENPSNVCYNNPGTYAVSLVAINAHGQDSVFKNDFITVNPVYNHFDTLWFCPSELPVNIHGNTIDTAGTYVQTYTTVDGCDSMESITLIVKPDYSTSLPQVEGCDSVQLNGTWHYSTVVLRDTLLGAAANGCDSLVNQSIVVHMSYAIFDTILACSNELPVQIHGQDRDSAGTYTQTYTAIGGCDSIVHITLEIDQVLTTNMPDVVGCDSVMVNGNYYYQDQVLMDTLQQVVSGCDSVLVTQVRVYPSVVTVINEDYCEGDSVEVAGNYYSSVGIFYDTLQGPNGCDSTLAIQVGMLMHEFYMIDTNLCNRDELIVAGEVITQDGVYNDTLIGQAVNGCNVINEYDVTILPDASIEAFTTDSLICVGEIAKLEARGGVNYQWLDPINRTDTVVYVNPSEPTIYSVVDSSLCADPIAQVEVFVMTKPILFIPNAFSPNQKNDNELFEVKARGAESFHIQIYDRWGNQVFESDNINNSWDGTNDGKPYNEGAFVYKCDVKLKCHGEIGMLGGVTILN